MQASSIESDGTMTVDDELSSHRFRCVALGLWTSIDTDMASPPGGAQKRDNLPIVRSVSCTRSPLRSPPHANTAPSDRRNLEPASVTSLGFTRNCSQNNEFTLPAIAEHCRLTISVMTVLSMLRKTNNADLFVVRCFRSVTKQDNNLHANSMLSGMCSR